MSFNPNRFWAVKPVAPEENAKREIGRILWEIWDPIGVNEIPQAQDEYDSYVDGIFELLVNGATDAQLAAHLFHIATETMGLSGVTTEAMYPTVRALHGLTIK